MKPSLHSIISFLPVLLNHLRLPSPELNPVLDNNSQMNSSSTELSQLLTAADCSLGTSHYIALGLLSRIVFGVFTDPLPSSRCPIVVHIGSSGNVFTKSLPGCGSAHHSIHALTDKLGKGRRFQYYCKLKNRPVASSRVEQQNLLSTRWRALVNIVP
jgi:hypothetical protein